MMNFTLKMMDFSTYCQLDREEQPHEATNDGDRSKGVHLVVEDLILRHDEEHTDCAVGE